MKKTEKLFITTLILLLACVYTLFADSTYQVEKGDTLYSISRRFQITVAELRTANNISEKDVIKVGQKLVIPTANIENAVALTTSTQQKTSEVKSVIYTVQKGDTLYGIAKKNGMTVAEIMSLNGFDSSTVIKIGQKIKIKDSGVKVPSSTEVTKPSVEKTEPKLSENKNTEKDTKTPDTRTYGTTTDSDSSTIWPVKNPKVTPVKGKVSGVQLTAQLNEVVTCIREGTVMYVGTYRGFGQVLFIQSKTGVIYAYTGLGLTKVKKGDYVLFGKELGTAGIDSISGKPGITFMVFQNGQPIDPKTAPRN